MWVLGMEDQSVPSLQPQTHQFLDSLMLLLTSVSRSFLITGSLLMTEYKLFIHPAYEHLDYIQLSAVMHKAAMNLQA